MKHVVRQAVLTSALLLAANLAHVVLTFRLLPGVELRRRHFSRASVRELFGFSVWNVLINAADQVQVHASALVVPIVMTTTALAHFNMGAILVPYALQLVNSIAWTLTPQATTLDARGDVDGLRRLWLGGMRAIVAFASILVGGMALLGDDLLRLWVDPKYTSGGEFVSSGTILAVLTLGLLLRAIATASKQLCFGLREVRLLAQVTFVEAVVNLVLTVALVAWLGILGAAISNVVAVALTQFWMLPRYITRRVGSTWSSVARALVAGGVVLVTMPLVHRFAATAVPADTWSGFALRVVILGVPALAVAVMVGTTREEKARLIRRVRGAI